MPAEEVASQMVLYVYAWDKKGWPYCEEKFAEPKEGRPEVGYEDAKRRCTPNLAVLSEARQ
jgi:hypothetical protein